MSKNTALGICPASNSLAGSRFSSGMYQEASTTRTSFTCVASHSVETRLVIQQTLFVRNRDGRTLFHQPGRAGQAFFPQKSWIEQLGLIAIAVVSQDRNDGMTGSQVLRH